MFSIICNFFATTTVFIINIQTCFKLLSKNSLGNLAVCLYRVRTLKMLKNLSILNFIDTIHSQI